MKALLAITLAALCSGCIELDFFLFQPETVDSVEEGYHGLPLWVGSSPPDWVANAKVEREIYIDVDSGASLPPEELGGRKEYIHGVFLHAPRDCPKTTCPLIDDPPTIIYQHGNSGSMWRYWWRSVWLWSLGADVFVYTYRGYGLSAGEPNKKNVLEDARAAAAYLIERPDVSTDRLVAYGYSMGGVTASYLVGKFEHKELFDACILEAPLDTPASAVKVASGTEMGEGYFLDEDTLFDGVRFIKGSRLPILHMHGRFDQVISTKQADEYYDALKDRPDYTHYLNKTDAPDEAWMKNTNHHTIPLAPWRAPWDLSHYFDSKKNPTGCCVHPLELTEPAHAGFLEDVGGAEGSEFLKRANDYRRLVADWLATVLK